MPSTTHALLTEIEGFLAESGVSPTKFGLAAVNDGHLIKNLRGGASVTLKTADKVRATWPAAQPSLRSPMFHVKQSPPSASC
jgi:hypothetical protein